MLPGTPHPPQLSPIPLMTPMTQIASCWQEYWKAPRFHHRSRLPRHPDAQRYSAYLVVALECPTIRSAAAIGRPDYRGLEQVGRARQGCHLHYQVDPRYLRINELIDDITSK